MSDLYLSESPCGGRVTSSGEWPEFMAMIRDIYILNLFSDYVSIWLNNNNNNNNNIFIIQFKYKNIKITKQIKHFNIIVYLTVKCNKIVFLFYI